LSHSRSTTANCWPGARGAASTILPVSLALR